MLGQPPGTKDTWMVNDDREVRDMGRAYRMRIVCPNDRLVRPTSVPSIRSLHPHTKATIGQYMVPKGYLKSIVVLSNLCGRNTQTEGGVSGPNSWRLGGGVLTWADRGSL